MSNKADQLFELEQLEIRMDGFAGNGWKTDIYRGYNRLSMKEKIRVCKEAIAEYED